ncbi:MAG: phytanoyl-CoA dioxygenase family protein [Gammaproteobacteria bacterium]
MVTRIAHSSRTSLASRTSLVREGYCVARQVLDGYAMTDLAQWSRTVLNGVCAAHRSRNRSQGTLVNLSDYPEFAGIIGHPALAALFESLDFGDPVFSSGYLISKPPHGPALFWHQDWWGWDDPMSYSDTIAQVFVMIYLTRTTQHNGCLRVIPGSHRQRHPLHDKPPAHAEALAKVAKPHDPIYASAAGEQAVPVEPGDVVIGDARLLHGAYDNRSEHERTLITLWYHPDFSNLPPGMQARIREVFYRRGVDTDPESSNAMIMEDWPASQRQQIESLFPVRAADALPHAWNRQPDVSKLCAPGGS